MVDYLERNNLLCQNQHGFRKSKSCLTQLLHHLDDVINSLLSGNDVDAIYLDYAKAFDKVDHRLLLMKLRHYGFSDKMVEWIKSFLSNRYQKVVIEGRVSFLALKLSGVPQGTVLGPILFLIFINDITTCVLTSTIRCFADDTRVCNAVSSSQDVSDLQKDLENIINGQTATIWCYMKTSSSTSVIKQIDPTCCTSSRSHQHTSNITHFTLGGITLHPANNIRDLGVYISDDLSWTLHIATISDKARQMAAWIMDIQCFFHSPHWHTYNIVQIIASLPSRVLFSSVESIQNSRYPDSREYTANIYIKNRWTQGPPLLGKVEKTLTIIVTKEAGTLHSNSHVETPSWSHI